MKKETLKQLMEENEFKTFEIAAINTAHFAPRYLSVFTKRFKSSKLKQDLSTYFAWLATVLPSDYEFEVHEGKYLIFKGAIIEDKLDTDVSDIITK